MTAALDESAFHSPWPLTTATVIDWSDRHRRVMLKDPLDADKLVIFDFARYLTTPAALSSLNEPQTVLDADLVDDTGASAGFCGRVARESELRRVGPSIGANSPKRKSGIFFWRQSSQSSPRTKTFSTTI